MAKNFNDISCIFCGEKSDVRRMLCDSCNNPLHIGEEFIGRTLDDNYVLRIYKARGYYGLTYKAEDNYGKEFAIKLISKNSYLKHGKDFIKEAEMYARLPKTPSIVNYIGANEATLVYKGIPIEFYYIVSEWVYGDTFKDFISNRPVMPEDLISAARDLLLGLQELYESNLWHNDLHDENIMVEPLSQIQMRRFGRSTQWMFKIIDVGSMVYMNPSDAKPLRDMINVGHLLYQISEKLKLDFGELSKEDQYFIELLDSTCSQMIDEHPRRSFPSPMNALDQIEELYRNSRLGEFPIRKKLDTPYGYINANDIPSSWLLKHMFSDKLMYFSKIMSISEQCLLLTGPRGCGKTMIVKNMRFTTLYDAQEVDKAEFLSNLPYVGLFVSARTSFGNYLVSLRPQEWASNEAKVLFYFNILISIELIDVLYRLNFDGFVTDQQIKPVIDLLSERFSMPYVNLLTVKSKLVQISRKLIANQEVSITIDNSTPAYLNDLIKTFRSALPAMRDKEIIILLDDFSLPRVPERVQKAIIPAIFNTGAAYKTRVTAHSDGYVTQDNAGEVYKANRDFTEINLGYEYWLLSDNYDICRGSFDDILNKRFELAGRGPFIGTENLLDRGDKLEDIGREIHRLSKEGKLRTLNYYGAKVFIKLCSGDLSYLLEILGKMELRANLKVPIPIKLQSDVIKNYARNELRSLQDIKAEYVPSLYDIGYYFGVWSKSKLVNMDKDYLKIEVELQELSEESRTTLRELLCYGIFVDGGYSNNSDGKLSRRLFFRRIFTPAFPTTFNSRNTFPMRARSFRDFIFKPASFVRSKMSEDKINPDKQLEIEQLELGYSEGEGPNGYS